MNIKCINSNLNSYYSIGTNCPAPVGYEAINMGDINEEYQV